MHTLVIHNKRQFRIAQQFAFILELETFGVNLSQKLL